MATVLMWRACVSTVACFKSSSASTAEWHHCQLRRRLPRTGHRQHEVDSTQQWHSIDAVMPTADHSLTASVIIALEYWLRLADEQFFCSSSSIMTCNQSYIMSILFNCVLFSSVLWHCWLPSVLWRCWLGGRKGIRPVKNWVVRCWHSYLSGARCRLAYGPADATATHCLLLQ